MDHRLVALIPVNRFDRAKGRLSDLLSPDERSALALATMRTVLRAVREAGGHPIVLTADPDVARRVGEEAELLGEDPSRSGLNPQLEYAIEAIAADALLILHADLPLADAAALERMVRGAPPAPSAAIIRSPDGGTNAMFLQPPGCFPLHYGRDSAALHRRAAFAAGVVFSARSEPSLRLDLDTPDDLATLLQNKTGRESPARKLLCEWGVPARLAEFSG